MFEGFQLGMIQLPEATLRVRYGRSDSPLLLLHGHPRTHTTWHAVAPLLATSFTVVCPDLRGFGKSSKPANHHDYEAFSKRAKARDCVALMDSLGFEEFYLAGHDRGSYDALSATSAEPRISAQFESFHNSIRGRGEGASTTQSGRAIHRYRTESSVMSHLSLRGI
jgi:haloacetate dehalogenase